MGHYDEAGVDVAPQAAHVPELPEEGSKYDGEPGGKNYQYSKQCVFGGGETGYRLSIIRKDLG